MTNPIIVALDVPEVAEAVALAETLRGTVGHYKVGLELFAAGGPAAVEAIAAHGPVMLDLKLHDIPTTVERAARRLGRLGVAMLTIHATGGPGMVRAAVAGFGETNPGGTILAVTVLTSMSADDLGAVNQPAAAVQVPALAALATGAGAPGLVCAPRDLVAVRAAVGPDAVVVTPGVRPAGSTTDDHARPATPASALRDGANHLVVGRPITRADDPAAAARAILAELAAVGV